MRIDLPYCNFKNCKYQLDGNCTDQLMYERCEFNRMKDRLQIDPSGSDKIDELEEAIENIRTQKHGRWILERTPDGKPYCYHCSVCDDGFRHIGITTGYAYCPYCGAKMNTEKVYEHWEGGDNG